MRERPRDEMQMVVCVLALLSSTILLRAVTSLEPLDSWEVLIENAGVSAMHMTLAHTNKVIMFDRTDFGASQIRLADGFCRRDPLDKALHVDCWAHSIELDIATKTIRALTVATDTWCSSGRDGIFSNSFPISVLHCCGSRSFRRKLLLLCEHSRFLPLKTRFMPETKAFLDRRHACHGVSLHGNHELMQCSCFSVCII